MTRANGRPVDLLGNGTAMRRFVVPLVVGSLLVFDGQSQADTEPEASGSTVIDALPYEPEIKPALRPDPDGREHIRHTGRVLDPLLPHP